jgi:rifampin ADP-ribosylating transferase
MVFNPNNEIVKLCAQGIEQEASDREEACRLYQLAWENATNDFEKFIAAHYMARVQNSSKEKLVWDTEALQFALNINTEEMKANYPSLYLNIGKCYEDLSDFNNAIQNYNLALSYIVHLPKNGYGKMIEAGIISGIERVK